MEIFIINFFLLFSLILWEFHMIYSDFIHLPDPSLLFKFSFTYLFNFVSSIYYKPIESNICVHACMGAWVSYQGSVQQFPILPMHTFSFPFINWWTSKLIPFCNYCAQRSNRQGCASIFVVWYKVLWVYYQSGIAGLFGRYIYSF